MKFQFYLPQWRCCSRGWDTSTLQAARATMKKQTAKQIQCTPEIQSSLNLHARRFCGKVAELHHCFLEPRRCAMSFASHRRHASLGQMAHFLDSDSHLGVHMPPAHFARPTTLSQSWATLHITARGCHSSCCVLEDLPSRLAHHPLACTPLLARDNTASRRPNAAGVWVRRQAGGRVSQARR
jgi:hypothetical protein